MQESGGKLTAHVDDLVVILWMLCTGVSRVDTVYRNVPCGSWVQECPTWAMMDGVGTGVSHVGNDGWCGYRSVPRGLGVGNTRSSIANI